MKDILDAIRKAIKDKNWCGALFISLALPDICGKIENPNFLSGKRYKDWFNKYMSSALFYFFYLFSYLLYQPTFFECLD